MSGEKIYFKYYSGVNDDSKNAVKTAVLNFQQRVKQNKRFLSGLNIYVVNSYSQLPQNSRLTKEMSQSDNFFATGGVTVPKEINEGKKEIIVLARNQGITGIVFGANPSETDISQVTIHEIGHQFDTIFGNCPKELMNKVRQINFDNTYTKEEAIFSEYLHKKDLSDTKEFKKAWKDDVEKSANRFNEIPLEYTPYEIDISDGVTDEEVEQSDTARGEIFAQLFSYALGEDDGNKRKIIDKYKNCYDRVKLYIKQFLGIDCAN